MLPRLLIVTAVAAERDAVLAGVGDLSVLPDPLSPNAAEIDVVAVGVGPARAAAGTMRELALAQADGAPYRAVICAGIAGGFAGRAEIGDVVVATASVAADLGAESGAESGAGPSDGSGAGSGGGRPAGGFLTLEELGFGPSVLAADPALVPVGGARRGQILTVSTATGTRATADGLAERFPDALAEAMEGFGVATAANALGIPFAEVRAISNLVGPRDKEAWRLADALAALTDTFTTRKVA
jgi:futalosine hydrolase